MRTAGSHHSLEQRKQEPEDGESAEWTKPDQGESPQWLGFRRRRDRRLDHHPLCQIRSCMCCSHGKAFFRFHLPS